MNIRGKSFDDLDGVRHDLRTKRKHKPTMRTDTILARGVLFAVALAVVAVVAASIGALVGAW